MLGRLFASLAAGVLVFCSRDIYHLIRSIIHPYFSPLKRLPGPKGNAFIGNLLDVMDSEPTLVHHKWVEDHGHVFAFKSLFGTRLLFLADPRAVGHVLNHPMDYPMNEDVRAGLGRMLGDGILVVQGEKHRKERRIMNPAFGPGQIRQIHTVFYDKCEQLRDIWIQQIRSEDAIKNPADNTSVLIEVTPWLNKLTLDIIGLAGFNSSFNALNPNDVPNELNQALRDMMASSSNPSFLDFFHALLPSTRIIPSKADRRILHARKVMDRAGSAMLTEVKAAVRAAMTNNEISRDDFQARDLLTLLVRANMASDVPESSRLSNEEVLSQIPTFLLAGHETTSAALTWVLYSLACNQGIQDALRTEVLACTEGERPSMDTLSKMSSMDAVVRETLRLYAPVPAMAKEVVKDDFIPTETKWTDRNGNVREGIHVIKGDPIFIPILAMNRSKVIWGEDAYEFKPERWSNLPPSAASMPGVFNSGLTFSGGPKSCIGWRFSLAEIKVAIYTLLRTFRFSLALEPADIEANILGMTRPVIRGKVKDGYQLPLWVSLVDDCNLAH